MSEDLGALWKQAKPVEPQATLKHPKEENLSALWEQAKPTTQTEPKVEKPVESQAGLWQKAKDFVSSVFHQDSYLAYKQRKDEIEKAPDGIWKSVASGVEEVNDFLRHPIDNLFHSNEERARGDVSRIVAQQRGTSDTSLWSSQAKELLDATGARDMTPEEKKALHEAKMHDVQNISRLLKKRGAGYIGTDDSGKYFYVDKKGSVTPMGELDSVWDAMATSKFESIGAIAGALQGSKVPGPLPVKAVGALIGGAIGAGAGSMADYAQNATATDQPIETDKLTRRAAESATADPVMTLVTGGVFKGAKALTKPAVKKLKDFLLERNIAGAEKLLKQRGYTQEQIDEIVAKAAKYQEKENKSWLAPGLEKRRDALTDVAMQDKTLHKEVRNAMKQYPGVADTLSDAIEHRTKTLTEALDERGLSVPQLRKEIDDYERAVKDEYGQIKDIITRASSKYRFDIKSTGIPKVLKDLEKSVGEEHTKSDIKALLHTIKKHDKLDSKLLFNVREKINRILRKPSVQSYDDIDALRRIKQNIDDEIFNAIDNIEAKMPKDDLKKRMKDSIVKYARMKELQDTHLYKEITKDTADDASVSKAMTASAKTFSGMLDAVSKELDPSVRKRLEHRAIRDFVKTHTKNIDGTDVIDFAKLEKDLGDITSQNIRSKEAKETLDALREMSSLFKHDTDFMKTAANANVRELNQGISQNPLARIKTMLANKAVRNFLVYTQKDKALRYHIAKSLQKARTPKEFLANVEKLKGKAPDGFLRNMHNILTQWEKAEARAQQAQKRLKTLEEKRAKGEKVRKTELLKAQVENFKTPPIEEIQAVEKLNPSDKYRTFSQRIARIQDGTATKDDIRAYLLAKEKIDKEALSSELMGKKSLTDEELNRLNELDQKYNKPLFAAGGAAAAATGAAQRKDDHAGDNGDISGGGAAASDRMDRRAPDTEHVKNKDGEKMFFVGEKEINMHNNAVLKDGKLTREELVSLIEHAPDFEKQLESFGDVKTEGKEKVMNRMLSVFNEEDPITALAMVAENFYNGDDKKFMKAIQDTKIESISDAWVQDILQSDSGRKRADTPITDMFDRYNAKSFKYLDLDAIEGTTFTDDDGRGRTAWGGVDKEYSPEEFAMLQKGEINPSDANSRVMAREAKVTYKKLPWLKNAKQITQEIASILAMNVGGTGATYFQPTYKLIEAGDINEAISHIEHSRLTKNHKRHIIRALREYQREIV